MSSAWMFPPGRIGRYVPSSGTPVRRNAQYGDGRFRSRGGGSGVVTASDRIRLLVTVVAGPVQAALLLLDIEAAE